MLFFTLKAGFMKSRINGYNRSLREYQLPESMLSQIFAIIKENP